MSSEEPNNDELNAGLDLKRVQEQQARLKLGIPIYSSELNKKKGVMCPLTREQQSLMDAYLGVAHSMTETSEKGGDGEDTASRLTPEALVEAIANHRESMQDAFDDIRGRIGYGGEGLVPEPGSAQETIELVPVMEYIQEEMKKLLQSGRTKNSDSTYMTVRGAYNSLLSYLDHRKAALGLAEYMKQHFASYLSEQEKKTRLAERDRAAAEKARSWMLR
ncbi:MAG: hypothetical protein HGB34_00045 [Candidatus Moranbacteria bacterium]|nr:hypothetical protein [Candidatus Moranbacteria bacterium]